MLKKTLQFMFLAALVTSMAACGRGSTDDDRDTTPDKDVVGTDVVPEDSWWDDDTYIPSGRTVVEIQQSDSSVNCTTDGFVNLDKDVQMARLVIVSPKVVVSKDKDTGAPKLDGYYVMDYGLETAVPFSGVLATVSSADNTNFQMGDVIHPTVDIMEYYCMTQISLKSHTVLMNKDVPAPLVIDPVDLGSQDPLTAEPFEGVLVELQNVTVTSANPDGSKDYGHFQVTGDVIVGNDFGLAYMNKGTSQRTVGHKFDRIIGVVKYDFGQYVLMPRFAQDMVLQGTSSDVIDPEDGVQPADGQIKAIQQSSKSTSCTSEVQQDPDPVSVTLTDVVVVTPVMSASANLEAFFVAEQDSADDPEFRGVMVTVRKDMNVPYVPGDVLTITGIAVEYFCQTQITAYGGGASITKTGTAPVPEPYEVDPIRLANGGSDDPSADNYTEPIEGVVVTIRDVEITSTSSEKSWFVVKTQDGHVTGIEVSKDFSPSFSPSVGKKIARITGPVKYGFSKYRLMAMEIETSSTPVEPTPDVIEPVDTTDPDEGTTIHAIQSAAKSAACDTEVQPTYDPVFLPSVVVASTKFEASSGKDWYYLSEQTPDCTNGYTGILVLANRDKVIDGSGSGAILSVGDVVDVRGNYNEYFCMSQVNIDKAGHSMEKIGTMGSSWNPGCTGISKTLLENGGGPDTERWEGMLITINGPFVGQTASNGGKAAFAVGNPPVEILKDINPTELSTPATLDPSIEYSSLTGFVRYMHEMYRLAPRGAADMSVQ